MAMSNDQKENLENIQLREMESDYAINMTENYYGSDLQINWVDIINYTYDKVVNCKGIMKLRVKEQFLEEVVDEKLFQVMKSNNDDSNSEC